MQQKTMTPLIMVAVIGLVASAFAQEQPAAPKTAPPKPGYVPLKWKEPKPLFTAPPVINARLPNLEKAGKRGSTFYVPDGVVNIAKDKPVTSSDDVPIIGELEMVNDGNNTGKDGSYVEIGPLQQWVQIDLEKESEIYAILFWHYHKAPRVYHDVIVQVSNDKRFFDGVKTLYNNDHDNSSGMGAGKSKAYIETSQGQLIDAKGVKARYVRLYSNGSTATEMNHYCEVEIHGK